MFRGLENLKKSHKGKLSDGKYIGGGAGRLTATADGSIARLSELYRNAIRQNSKKDINMNDANEVKNQTEKMKTSIMAILYHSCKSDDDAERHKYCPANTEEVASWCEYKKTGRMEDKPHHLDSVFLDLLMPVFTRLSEHDLLVRCLNGFTQNQNESFNALIWKRCPKHLWRGPAQIEVGLNLAVLTWNGGCSKTRRDCLQGLGLTYGKHSADASNAKDLKRVKVSSERLSECEKKKRAALTKQKLHAEEIKKQKERTNIWQSCICRITSSS